MVERYLDSTNNPYYICPECDDDGCIVVHVQDESEDFWGCGECGNVWATEDELVASGSGDALGPVTVESPWGTFVRASWTVPDSPPGAPRLGRPGEVHYYDWYEVPGVPLLTIRTVDPHEVERLVPRLEAYFSDPDAMVNRAITVIVKEKYGKDNPTTADIDSTAGDLTLAGISVKVDGILQLAFTDSSGDFCAPEEWLAVDFDTGGSATNVSVEI